MASLPDDVIVDILSRVPAKSVQRLRCVSKHWLSLTTDPTFIKLHLQRSIQNNSLNFIILTGTDSAVPQENSSAWIHCLPNNSFDGDHDIHVQNPPLDCFQYDVIAGSCNGLVCMIGDNCGMVFNPATREFNSFQFPNYREGLGVGVDNKVICTYSVYGFGYDFVDDDYKLVQFIAPTYPHLNRSASKIFVHSLNNSPSVEISDVPYYNSVLHDCGVYLDGALHWVGAQMEPPQHEKIIVSFDVAHKVVREFPVPVPVDIYYKIELGSLQGQLSSFITLSSSFEIWIMKTYGAGDSWYKLASIDQAEAFYGSYPTLLGFSRSGGVLLRGCGYDFFLYDLEQKTGEHILMGGIDGLWDLFIITDTLVSCVLLPSGKSAKLPLKNPWRFG